MCETGESFVPASRIRNIPIGDTKLGFPSIRRSTEHVGTPQGNLYRLDFFAVLVRNFHRNRPGFWLVRFFLPETKCDARKKNRGIRNGSCGTLPVRRAFTSSMPHLSRSSSPNYNRCLYSRLLVQDELLFPLSVDTSSFNSYPLIRERPSSSNRWIELPSQS